MTAPEPAPRQGYSFLGPSGTFTEAALRQVPEAQGAPWRAVHNVGEALQDVLDGTSIGAMIAIENSVDGGVTATLDALARIPGVRILGEYVVPVTFALVVHPGTTLAGVTTVAAHPVAYAQCRGWLEAHLPDHRHIPQSSNVAAARFLVDEGRGLAEAAIAPPTIVERLPVESLADSIGDNPNAVTRFVLVGRTTRLPARTGADKTSIIAELPVDHPGALLELLEQFSTRGINMSLLQSRPIGDALGRYRFIIDLDGHVADERVADALMGVRRFSPKVQFLGSYPRADRITVDSAARYDDEVFAEARDWLRAIVTEEPEAGR